ncbi:MAG: hypothetical protein M1150_02130 [Patescibacteria group bacterium]|nr:hypothetical protein [Patescibacteria group bacterium]
MRNLEFGLEVTLTQILESIKAVPEKELQISVAKDAVVLKNPANLKILEKAASSLGKTIHFSDNLASSLNLNAPEFVEGEDIFESHSPAAANNPESSNFNPKLQEKKKGLKFGLPKLSLKPSLPLAVAFLLVLIFAGGTAAYWYLPNAKVVLYVTPKSFTKDASLSASTRLSVVDTEERAVPLTEVSSTETGTLSAQSTGKKTIGDHAKGAVTIRNYNTISPKSFDKGALLKVVGGTNDGTKFSLDNAVTIPTASESATTDAEGNISRLTVPGKVEVSVSAVEIGKGGNVDENTRFSVGDQNLANVDAVNKAAFSGGSSREVTVVASSDRKKLLETLSKQLSEKARGNLKSKLSNDQVILEGTIKESASKETYNKDIEAEASEVNLNLTWTVVAKAYSKDDLKKVMQTSIEKDIPDGYEIDPGKLDVSAEASKDSDGDTVDLLSRVDGMLLPKIDSARVTGKLQGISLSSANDYLKSLDNIEGYEVRLWPTLPSPLNTLPHVAGNIKIEFVSK